MHIKGSVIKCQGIFSPIQFSMESKLKDVCIKLYEVGALKFGNFKMKVGATSPVYLDLRIMISFPSLLITLSEYIWEYIKENNLKFDHVCGVPYTALPLATVISVHAGLPMLIRRKEAKDYGTRKIIEGKFNEGDTSIIIEDVVTTGSSIMDTVHDLQTEGVKVTDTIVVVDREQGGGTNLEAKGVKMHSLMTLSQVIEYLHEAGKIGEETVAEIKKYLKDNQMDTSGKLKTLGTSVSRLQLPFLERAKLSVNKVSQRLFEIMNNKQSNLCVAADVPTVEKLLTLANTVGPHVCLFKTHIDAIKGFTQDVGKQLHDLAQKYEFLIMEDRKFADIGHIVSLQYSIIQSWADLVTVHSLPGDGVLEAIKLVSTNSASPRGAFVVAEMSCKGNLITPQYTKAVIRQASAYPEVVVGVVCQSPELFTSPGIIQLTPGVCATAGSDNLGQQYFTPDTVVKCKGADIAVVGRAIVQADDPAVAAKTFQQQLWQAYTERISQG